MYQYFFYVNKYRSKEAKRKTGHPRVCKVNASSVCRGSKTVNFAQNGPNLDRINQNHLSCPREPNKASFPHVNHTGLELSLGFLTSYPRNEWGT